jgi:hypothetical protein
MMVTVMATIAQVTVDVQGQDNRTRIPLRPRMVCLLDNESN